MTSTSFNVGLNDTARLSSRVLRPPGGGHTDIFGSEPEPPRTGRRPAPQAGQGDEIKATNGTDAPASNGQASTPQEAPAPVEAKEVPAKIESPKIESPPKIDSPTKSNPEPAKMEPPKRVRVPPGGFSSGLWARARGMEGGGRQSRLLGRLLGKLRGDHHKYNALDKRFSVTSSGMSESTGCGSTINDDDDLDLGAGALPPTSSNAPIDDGQFAANIDLRYGGQYLTPEQLPEFCDQLHHLVEVIRNIQSYARVTGEYPSKLERRLEEEAREVAALAAEARNARDVVGRARTQRKAVRAQRKHLTAHLAGLRETEVRELESTVRLSDRKLFKSWEVLKDSSDPAVFEPLLEEVKNKQTALECLVRLIESRQAALARTVAPPQPLPPPEPKDHEETTPTTGAAGRKRHDSAGRRTNCKRRRKDTSREPRSVPLSVEQSRHAAAPQVTLYIQGTESTSRYRVGSTGAVALTPLELPSGGSVRDILFFTTN